jgi:hypothetical protein
VSRWTKSQTFGAIGDLGMFVFFLTAIIAGWDDAREAVMLPSGVAMWVGYPASWYFAWRERDSS